MLRHHLYNGMLLQLYHLIFGNSKAAAKGTGNWFLWIMLTLLNSSLNLLKLLCIGKDLKVHCQDIQLDNDITAKFFIVTPVTKISRTDHDQCQPDITSGK